MSQNKFNQIMNQIQLSEQDKDRILKNCKKQKHVDNKLFLYSGQIAAALCIALLSATSLTAYAAVNAYQAYMEQMSAEEVQERYDNLHEGIKEGDSFSRKLTEVERERMNQLREEYWQGLRFPTTSMPCFDGTTADKPTDTTISYDYVNMVFHIPETELSDEELLQIIDMWEKGNYSLKTINNADSDNSQSAPLQEDGELSDEEEEKLLAEALAEMAKHTHAVPQTDEEIIKQSALATISAVTGKDLSSATWTVTLYGEHNPQYRVTCEDGTRRQNIFYTPDSTPEHLVVRRYADYDMSDNVPVYAATDITEAMLQDNITPWAQNMKEILSDSFGVSDPVVKCEYFYEQELFSGETNCIQFCLTTSTGDRYLFTYNVREQVLRELQTYEIGKYDEIDLTTGHDVYGIIEL